MKTHRKTYSRNVRFGYEEFVEKAQRVFKTYRDLYKRCLQTGGQVRFEPMPKELYRMVEEAKRRGDPTAKMLKVCHYLSQVAPTLDAWQRNARTEYLGNDPKCLHDAYEALSAYMNGKRFGCQFSARRVRSRARDVRFGGAMPFKEWQEKSGWKRLITEAGNLHGKLTMAVGEQIKTGERCLKLYIEALNLLKKAGGETDERTVRELISELTEHTNDVKTVLDALNKILYRSRRSDFR